MSLQLENRAVLGLTTGTQQLVTRALHCVCVLVAPQAFDISLLAGVLGDCCNHLRLFSCAACRRGVRGIRTLATNSSELNSSSWTLANAWVSLYIFVTNNYTKLQASRFIYRYIQASIKHCFSLMWLIRCWMLSLVHMNTFAEWSIRFGAPPLPVCYQVGS